jgi:propanol-preferring alcohol dehydrogenase
MRAWAVDTPGPIDGGPLRQVERPVPEPGPSELLVEVRACGVCRTDLHLAEGDLEAHLPGTVPGHEAVGVVRRRGPACTRFSEGDRVGIAWLRHACGACRFCHAGRENLCTSPRFTGWDTDGGYADLIRVPAGNAHPLPDFVPFEQGAILMCSSATALHALHKARVATGDAVAVFGIGGLGVSAIQLAHALGADVVYAVDVNPAKLALAKRHGAVPVDARAGDPVQAIRAATGGRGVDTALELIGFARTMEQAVEVLAPQGRAALAGLTQERMSIAPYRDILSREAEIIGVSDHLASEIGELMDFIERGQHDLSHAVTRVVPLDAATINGVLDDLEAFRDDVRTVIRP